jgi:endonuclease/exonuclease/phosphatase family metal-dependent hydrolase
MKLLSLNTWGGKVFDPLISFIEQESKDTDIFFFQEVFHSPISGESSGNKTDLYNSILKALPDFTGFYAPTFTGYDTEKKVDFELAFGQATFLRKSLDILSEETYFVHGDFDYKPEKEIEGVIDGMDLPRNIHCSRIKVDGKEVLLGNFHGFWIPGPKVDTPESLSQMDAILEIYNSFGGPKIIAGDFNLRPDTESMLKLESIMKNLIKEFKIGTTRSHYYKKTEEKFADYVLVSDEIKVNKFEVSEKAVSDHLPMILDFSI